MTEDVPHVNDTTGPSPRPSEAWVRQCEVAARTGETDAVIYTLIGQLPFRGLP